jgi:hypothetical protein
VAPSRRIGARAHQNGGSTVRRRKRHRAAVFSGGGVAPVVVDEGGWVLKFEGDLGVRRRRSVEGRSSSEGHSPEGAADGGDARTQSGAEEGLRWRKTSEVDAWAMGMSVQCPGMDGRDERCMGEKLFGRWATARFSGERRRGGPGGVGTAWRWSRRERGREGGPGCGVGWRVAACQWRTVGSARRESTWLTGGPGRYGGPIVSGWVQRRVAR